MTAKTGYFLFSLDTELAWGYFDSARARERRFSSDGIRERESIVRLLDLLDEFRVAATWACVGHMFYDRCEACATCPILAWKGKYNSFEDVYETSHPLWYGADVIDMLLTRGARHEIAFHGYTHEVFDEGTMTEEAARTEILEWLRVAKRKNIVPRTVVFPRNKVGYLHLFKEFGFLCYRGSEPASNTGIATYLGKIRRRLRQVPYIFTPPVYDRPMVGPPGLLNLPSAPNYFKRGPGLNRYVEAINMTRLRMSGAIRGVRTAAEQGKITHLWSHPCDFRTETDWKKLRYLLSYVSSQVAMGRLKCITMGDLAREVHVEQS